MLTHQWGWGAEASRLQRLGWLLYWWMPMTCAFAGGCLAWRYRARSSSLAGLARAWWPGLALLCWLHGK